MSNSNGSKGAFGELISVGLTPVIQLKFPYLINPNTTTKTTTNGGLGIVENGMMKISTSTATNGSCSVVSKDVLNYRAGQGLRIRFTASFTTGVANSLQEVGYGDNTDGLFFGYNGANFCIFRRVNGEDNVTNMSSWSEYKNLISRFSSFDPTKLNVYQIVAQWLGAGMINFYVENSLTGDFMLVHSIPYTSLYNVPSIYNPSLPIRYNVINTGNNTDLIIKSASCAGFLEGNETNVNYINYSINNNKTGITTETNILTLKNTSLFLTKTNRIVLKVNLLSLASEGTKPVLFKMYKGATLGGTPSYTDIDTGNCPLQYDTAGTTVTGGREIYSASLAKSDSHNIDFSDFHYHIEPNETITISATSSANTEAFVSVVIEVED